MGSTMGGRGPGSPDPWASQDSGSGLSLWLVVGAAAFALVAAVGVLVIVLLGRGDDDSGAGTSSTTTTTTTTTTTSIPTPPSTPQLPPRTTTALTGSATTSIVADPPTITSAAGGTGGPYMSEADASAELAAILAEDRGPVDSLVDQWVPQVSSKQPGKDVEGDDRGAYTAVDILADHLGYEDRLSADGIGVRLLLSDEFNFKSDGYYVTVVDLRFPTGEAANAWCDSRGIGVDDCYAKRLSRSDAWRGSVLLRK